MSSSLNLSESELLEVASNLADADFIEKKAKRLKEDLRGTLFNYAAIHNSNEVLAQRRVEIPMGFFSKAGISEADFFATRHPGWRVIDKESNEDEGVVEFLLEEDPDFKPFSVTTTREEDGKRVVVGKTVQRNSPEIDSETLQRAEPELYDKIYRPVITYEVDVNALEQLLNEEPDVVAKLELHMKIPAPVKKLIPIKEAKDG